MLRSLSRNYSQIGIESVAVGLLTPVSRVDLMTRDSAHAEALRSDFGVQPFRFQRSDETVFAFTRLPARSVQAWMEGRGLSFERVDDGLGRRDLRTWVHGGV